VPRCGSIWLILSRLLAARAEMVVAAAERADVGNEHDSGISAGEPSC
jgi:hypothetical protein